MNASILMLQQVQRAEGACDQLEALQASILDTQRHGRGDVNQATTSMSSATAKAKEAQEISEDAAKGKAKVALQSLLFPAEEVQSLLFPAQICYNLKL